MEAFRTNKALRAELNDMQAALDRAESEFEALSGEFDKIKQDQLSKEETIATLTTENSSLKEEKETLSASLAESNEALEASRKETEQEKESAMAKAKDIAASAGHEKKVIPEKEDNNLEARIDAAQKRVESASSGSDKYKAVKELKELKNSK